MIHCLTVHVQPDYSHMIFQRSLRPLGACLALATALASTVTSPWSSAQINLPNLGDSLSGTISTQQEYEFGRELLRQIRRETPMMDDPLIMEYITSLSYRLATHSDLSNPRLEFVLIDSRVLNAFAAPGGIIGINTGLFEYADNEGQFASVIAHELAHVSQRHYARSAEMARNNTLPNLATMLASIVIASTAGGEAGEAAIATAQAARIDSQLRYSRSNEAEADRVGIRTLHDAGFNPYDMSGMFTNMLQRSSGSQRMPEFLSTHPLDENRVADTRNRATALPVVQSDYNVEFGLMKERVTVHYSNDPDTIISARERALPQLSGKEADSARYGLALAYLKKKDYLSAERALQPLLQKEPRRITYVMLQADIARDSGKADLALSLLEENLRINPGNHPLTMNYAMTLEESGRYSDSANALQSHVQSRPGDVQLWYHLAEIQGLAGNISQVHQARAEYFFGIGDFQQAQQQLVFALDEEQDPLAVARIRQRQNEMRQVQNRFYR